MTRNDKKLLAEAYIRIYSEDSHDSDSAPKEHQQIDDLKSFWDTAYSPQTSERMYKDVLVKLEPSMKAAIERGLKFVDYIPELYETHDINISQMHKTMIDYLRNNYNWFIRSSK